MSRPRLTRHAITPGQLNDVNVQRPDTTTALPLGKMDAGNVHAGKCPACEYSPLKHVDDMFVCPNCGMAYKTIGDETYSVFS